MVDAVNLVEWNNVCHRTYNAIEPIIHVLVNYLVESEDK